jgi:hypothetical protein
MSDYIYYISQSNNHMIFTLIRIKLREFMEIFYRFYLEFK